MFKLVVLIFLAHGDMESAPAIHKIEQVYLTLEECQKDAALFRAETELFVNKGSRYNLTYYTRKYCLKNQPN